MTAPSALTFLLLLSSAPASAAVVGSAGGSNYMFFGLNGCERSPFYVIPSYRAQKAVIDRQLIAMYQSGQRRLRLSIPLYPDPEKGPLASEALGSEYKQAIGKFLQAVRRTGFEEILVFAGDGKVPPANWKEWNEPAYQQRWSRIVEFRKILKASHLRYRIDLLNEGMPAANQQVLLKYAQRLWTDYESAFGIEDTIGFSIIPDIQQDRFAQMHEVYGTHPPAVFDLHFYAGAADAFLNAHRRLSELGYGDVPWILGESFYNDKQEAEELAGAIATTGQRVLFLLQWPLSSAKRCSDVDVAPPVLFDNYKASGFE